MTEDDARGLASSFAPNEHAKIASALLSYTLLASSTGSDSASANGKSSSLKSLLPSSSASESQAPSEVAYSASTRAFIARTLLLLNISFDHLLDAERVFSNELYHHIKDAEMKEKSEKMRKDKEEGWGGSWGRRIATVGGVTVSTFSPVIPRNIIL